MLQAIRSRAAGIVVKVLFSILVLSFAVWGIGDYTFLRRGDTTAVKIGDVSLSAASLQQEYTTEVSRLRRTLGQFDAEMARQFGLVDQVIQRIVAQTLLEKSADGLGVRIGDDVVRGRILSAPELQSPAGGFDRSRFQQFLYENSLSESGFVAQYRSELARNIVADAVTAGIKAPDALVERVYRYRNEKRAGQSVFVAAAAFGDVGKPDDAQLQSVYEDNRERFTAPEYRSVTVVRIGSDELLQQAKIDDRQIEEEYRARLPELSTPERRDVDQILFADEAGAKEAHEKLKGGTNFADVAKGANMTPEQMQLGTVTREDLIGGDLADAVFKLPLNGYSEPLRSPFGWHLFRVTRIEAGRQPSLAETKDRITTELRRRIAGEAAYDHATKVEDALAGGKKLEEAAASAGVPAVRIAAVDLRGRAPSGQAVQVFEGATDALSAAFETAAGRETQLIEARDNTWFIVRVDGVTPSTLRPLAEVRDEAVSLWQAEKREEAAKARADQILAAVVAGRTLEAAASPFGLKPAVVEPGIRNVTFDSRSTVPPEVNARLFALKVNEAAVAPGRDGVYVVLLTQIVAADPSADAGGIERLRTQLQQQIGNDLIGEYADALRQRFGVTVNRDIVDKIL